ncbi:unnamed protein product [marine sediment metagenome]|uniref:Uncharacterized protein n=1 Tax=marine sediment metagenome TaxID=412755 RepID=X1VYW5_9ZZZZ
MPIKTICETCGKVIYKSPRLYETAKHHFCSRECSFRYRAENPNEYKKV